MTVKPAERQSMAKLDRTKMNVRLHWKKGRKLHSSENSFECNLSVWRLRVMRVVTKWCNGSSEAAVKVSRRANWDSLNIRNLKMTLTAQNAVHWWTQTESDIEVMSEQDMLGTVLKECPRTFIKKEQRKKWRRKNQGKNQQSHVQTENSC